MKKYYIDAVLDMIQAEKSSDEILHGLDRVLSKRGHESLKVSVLSGVIRILEAQSSRSSVIVKVANTAHINQHKAAIETALQSIGVNKDFNVVEDETLIGGFVAEADNKVHDASYKTALVKLYRKIAK